MKEEHMNKIEKLRGAGFTVPEDTPDVYVDVLENLGDAEVAVLVGASALLESVAERLERAKEEAGDPDLIPPLECVHPPPF